VGGGLDPLASIVEAGVGLDGVDNGFRGGSDGFGLLDEEAESVAEIAVAAGEGTQSVGVAVQSGAARKTEFTGDAVHLSPLENSFLDGFAMGMAADGALE